MKPNRAKVGVFGQWADIAEFLKVLAADADGVIDLTKSTCIGLLYQFREGTTLVGLDAKVLSATKDGDGDLRLRPALHAQSASAILHSAFREVLASTVYVASVAMANGWRG